MASITKRGDKWRAQVRINGASESGTFRTKADANLWAARRETELADLADGKLLKRTVAETFADYKAKVCILHKGERWESIRLDLLARYLPKGLISDITPADIAQLRDDRLKVVTGGSVLRELQLLSAVFESAKERGFCRDNPVKKIKRPKANRPRDRVITDSEIAAVVAALGYSDDKPVVSFKQQVAVMFLLALETGMRAGELEALEWNRVNMERSYIQLLDTKNDTARQVPLSAKAKKLLERMRGVDGEQVFIVTGQTRDTIFRKARKSIAELAGFTFHDARHTAATRIAKRLDLMDLCKMFGWKNPKQAMVYYNPSATDMAARLD